MFRFIGFLALPSFILQIRNIGKTASLYIFAATDAGSQEY